MRVTRRFDIRGMGKCLPGSSISSSQIEQQHQIPQGWAYKHSGVKERYHAVDISGGEMGAIAVTRALKSASIELGEVDLLISTSATFDYPIPNQASVIKSCLKDGTNYPFPVLSIDSTCTGFISGIDIAAYLLDGRRFTNIVLVSSEIASKGINPENWESITLFGDAAVAAVLSFNSTSSNGLIKAMARTYSEGISHAIIRGGGNVNPINKYPYDTDLHTFDMAGIPLLKLAKRYIPPFMNDFFSTLEIDITDIQHILPHQASKAGLNVFENLYPFTKGQVMRNLDIYGNCISASIPLLLHDGFESGSIATGSTCLLCGTSAGFSIGSVLIKV